MSATRWDTFLYGGSAVFAVLMALVTTQPAQRQWGEMAAGPYAIGAGLAWWLGRRSAGRGQPRLLVLRYAIGVAVFVAVVAVPLILEADWQQDCAACIHEQPEVGVIIRAASREYAHQPLYRLAGSDFEKYFPYQPAMAFFGAPAAVRRASWTDPRIGFTAVGVVTIAAALVLLRVRGPTRLRAGQLLLASPAFALAAATGGDDLPVIGLMVLALACFHNRKAVASGLAFGGAAMLKLTAWPLGPLLLVAAYSQRWSRRRTVMAMAAAVALMAGSFYFSKPGSSTAVLDNLLLFPLGLSPAHSPAASPLPGEILATDFGTLGHRIALGCLVLAEAAICLRVWRGRRYRSTSDVASWLAAGMLAAILFSSASRFGYLIYPADLFVFAYLARRHPPAAETGGFCREATGADSRDPLRRWLRLTGASAERVAPADGFDGGRRRYAHAGYAADGVGSSWGQGSADSEADGGGDCLSI